MFVSFSTTATVTALAIGLTLAGSISRKTRRDLSFYLVGSARTSDRDGCYPANKTSHVRMSTD
jgi:hypothetical protein